MSADTKFIDDADVKSISYTTPTARLVLRTPLFSDAENYADRYNDPTTTKYIPGLKSKSGTFTPASTSKTINRWRTTSLKTSAYFSVVLKSTDEVIGDGGYGGLDLNKKSGDCGVVLSKEFRGKGYATESLIMMFDLGFGQLGLEEITIGTDTKNEGMRRILCDKLKLNGAENMREEDGEITWDFVVKKEEWEARR